MSVARSLRKPVLEIAVDFKNSFIFKHIKYTLTTFMSKAFSEVQWASQTNL